MSRRRDIQAANNEPLQLLPSNGVILALVLGDSTGIGWNATTASIRSTLPGGAELDDVTLWNKWDELLTAGGSLRLLQADDGTDWDPMQSDKGVDTSGGGAFHAPCYGVGYSLREKYRDLFASGTPDIRIVNVGLSGGGLGETIASAGACFHPDRAGTTAWVLMRDYYLAPAITHLLAAGKRIFFESTYSSIGGSEGQAPGTVGYPLVFAHGGAIAAFQTQLALDLGIDTLPWAAAKVYDYEDATYTNLADIRAAQEEYTAQNPSYRLMRDVDTLERQTDGLHYTGEGSLQLGLRLGATWSPGEIPLQEITAAPA